MNFAFKTLIGKMQAYLCGKAPARDVVRAIDEVVSSDQVYDLPSDVKQAILDLQDRTAMYVADAARRSEFPGYIGDTELRELIEAFLRKYEGR